jgi:predicted nucleic acid-binding protein
MAAEIFIDTAFLIALLRAPDAHHARSRKLAEALERDQSPLVTTDAVLLEFANFFARLPARRSASRWIARIRADKGWRVERLEATLLARGEARYHRFADKNWSLTDCISMEVMEERGIRKVATTDGGFAQAGFTLLL